MNFISSNNQCQPDEYKSACMSKLREGFTYLKTYSLAKKNAGEIEHSFVFSKNVTYMLTCETDIPNETRVEIKLYDKNKKLLFSNFNKKKDAFYTVNYLCSYTGVHYMKFIHHNEKAECGLSVLAFKR